MNASSDNAYLHVHALSESASRNWDLYTHIHTKIYTDLYNELFLQSFGMVHIGTVLYIDPVWLTVDFFGVK